MYDVAHLAGSAATGAMTVAINGQLTPQNYRHFTIRSGNDDVARLTEMLTTSQNRLAKTRPYRFGWGIAPTFPSAQGETLCGHRPGQTRRDNLYLNF